MLRRAIGGRRFIASGFTPAFRFASTEQKAAAISSITAVWASKPNFFSNAVSTASLDEYINRVNFGENYLKAFSAEHLSEHVAGYISAKLAEQSGKKFEFVLETSDYAFYFCRSDTASQLRTEALVETYFLQQLTRTKTHAVTLRSYVGEGTVLYTLEWTPFPQVAPAGVAGELALVATEKFMRLRTPQAKKRYTEILDKVKGSIKPVYTIHEVDDSLVLTIGFQPDRTSYLSALTKLISLSPGAVTTKKFAETFKDGRQVYTYFVKGTTKAQLEEKVNLIGLLPHRPDAPATRLYNECKITPTQAIYVAALSTFAFYFTPPQETDDFTTLSRNLRSDSGSLRKLKDIRNSLVAEIMSETYITQVIGWHLKFVTDLYDDFERGPTKESCDAFRARLETPAMRELTRSERDILQTFVVFNEAVRKTNFFKVEKAAVAFRLDPTVFISRLDFPTMPHGVFMFIGGAFRGFHVRFADIARGGIRLVLSKTTTAYRNNRRTLFQENYNLAHAQLLKNKDIPESGSKGIILVTTRRAPPSEVMFLQYVDAMLDVLLPGEPGVRDQLGVPEILFLGPDENTAGEFPSMAAKHAHKRGYATWKGFTTGKGNDMGGIPHDAFGMTTLSVRAHCNGIYRTLGLDQTKLTKFQTGGPDGDLGSNEIHMSGETYIGVTDLSGTLYDAKGLNRAELERLAHSRVQVDHFDTKLLSDSGFFVPTNATQQKLFDGSIVENGTAFRDSFFLSEYVKTDMFVPCGGRPASVTLANVHKLVVNCPADITGDAMLEDKVGNLAVQDKLRYKYIVEGANLFITQDARLALENVGVILIKDSSANKGGVTSSSIEVLSALALSDSEHAEHMCVRQGQTPPPFYTALVKEIMQRITYNAAREFEAIQREVELGSLGKKRTLISDALSRKIVVMRTNVMKSNLFSEKVFVRHVLRKYVPTTVQSLVPIDKILERVPDAYLRSIFAMWIASDYIYTVGLAGDEFTFFQYMHKLNADAIAQNA